MAIPIQKNLLTKLILPNLSGKSEGDVTLPKILKINFIVKLKREGKSFSSIHNYVSAVKAYYQINDVILKMFLNVRKIGKFMPEQKRVTKSLIFLFYILLMGYTQGILQIEVTV